MTPVVTENTLILAMQNGLGAAERVRKELPDANVLLGVAEAFGAEVFADAAEDHVIGQHDRGMFVGVEGGVILEEFLAL